MKKIGIACSQKTCCAAAWLPIQHGRGRIDARRHDGIMSAALYTLAAAALLAAGGMLASHQHLATTVHEHPHLAAPVTRLRPRDPHRLLIFVGGLQRSGTTALASALEALPDASGQSFRWLFANLNKGEAEARVDSLRSWRGVTRRYLDDVIKSGGLEGKFAQNVYPYAYTLRDWGDSVHAVDRLSLGSAEASPQKAGELWRQWYPYWNRSSAVLVRVESRVDGVEAPRHRADAVVASGAPEL